MDVSLAVYSRYRRELPSLAAQTSVKGETGQDVMQYYNMATVELCQLEPMSLQLISMRLSLPQCLRGEVFIPMTWCSLLWRSDNEKFFF